MNKIYKVIWSKVKHQYVVVSELAHSNGKQSRTAKRSLRSRIAALVVCGAVAAFGMYGALPVQQVFAATRAETTAGQYIAVAVDPDANNDKYWDNTTNDGLIMAKATHMNMRMLMEICIPIIFRLLMEKVIGFVMDIQLL